MKFIFLTLLLPVLSCGLTSAQDSLKIYFVGAAYNGETFKVRSFENDNLFEKKLGGVFIDSLTILTKNKDEGDPLSIHISRKAKFCFFYKDVILPVRYRKGYKYLFLNRDFFRKNKYAFEFIYSNEYLEELEVLMFD